MTETPPPAVPQGDFARDPEEVESLRDWRPHAIRWFAQLSDLARGATVGNDMWADLVGLCAWAASLLTKGSACPPTTPVTWAEARRHAEESRARALSLKGAPDDHIDSGAPSEDYAAVFVSALEAENARNAASVMQAAEALDNYAALLSAAEAERDEWREKAENRARELNDLEPHAVHIRLLAEQRGAAEARAEAAEARIAEWERGAGAASAVASALYDDRTALRARVAELEAGLDAVGHALGICYDHDHGCGGHGPVDAMVLAAKDGCAARGNAIEAGLAEDALRARVKILRAAMHAAALLKCPACPGNDTAGHDDRCWYGTVLRGVSGPAYDGAVSALAGSGTTAAEAPSPSAAGTTAPSGATRESGEPKRHTGTGNCWLRAFRCGECGKGKLCDACHEHDSPRGECPKCPPCRACELPLESGGRHGDE